jgi:hypothetical protein
MKTYRNQFITTIFLLVISVITNSKLQAQACTPAGDQVTYGSNNVWLGYVYSGTNFNTYHGYITAGTTGSDAFDHNFGGSNTTFVTNGCPITTQQFSVRYKLTKTFTNQNTQFTVSGDDGFRLSIDGGATWLINRWNDQGYTTTTVSAHMNGTYNLVLEYYENAGDNRITFASAGLCTGSDDPSVYGTGNVWRAYVYEGRNFDSYKGSKTEGSASDLNFDEGFGGDNVTMNWLSCPITTSNFSARFRLNKTFAAGTYMFTIGGDDGYRLSLDGGATWVIDRWVDQSYSITTYTTILNGNHNMVLEYYENGGSNRVSFTMSQTLILPVKLKSFNATLLASKDVQLNWKTSGETAFEKYIVQRSTDGRAFQDISSIAGIGGNSVENNYQYVDQASHSGTVYYRLAMKDLDGTITYSGSVSVAVPKFTTVKMYPTTITNQAVFLESDKNIERAKVEMFDMNGRNIMTRNMAVRYGKQTIALPATPVKGFYSLRISSDTQVVINNILIVQ